MTINNLKVGTCFSIFVQFVLTLAFAEAPLEFKRVPAQREITFSNGVEKGCFSREGICTGQYWLKPVHFGTPKQLAFGGAVGSDEDWFTQYIIVVPLDGSEVFWLAIDSAQRRGVYVSELYDGVNNKILLRYNFRNSREHFEHGLLNLDSMQCDKLQSSSLEAPAWTQNSCGKFGAELPLHWKRDILSVTKTPIETEVYFGVGFFIAKLEPRFYVFPFGHNLFAALDSVSNNATRIIVFDQSLRTVKIDAKRINAACMLNVCRNLLPPNQKMLNSEFGHCVGICENQKCFAIRFTGDGKIEAVGLPILSKPSRISWNCASPSGERHVTVFETGNNVHDIREVMVVTNFAINESRVFEFPQKFKSNDRLSFRGICDDGSIVVDNSSVGMWKMQIENATSYRVKLNFKYPFKNVVTEPSTSDSEK